MYKEVVMIDYINAIVVQKGLGYIIADCNNIGYRLLVSQNTSYELELEKRQMIYTHLIVKEDGMTLIGFSSILERDMFEILISVSKVGAKIALSILSTYTPNQIANFIKSSDTVSLSKVSGLGRKTAERLALELKDKVNVFVCEEVASSKKVINKDIKEDFLLEAIEALVMLGFTNKESTNAVEKAYSSDENADVQTIIRTSLSLLKK
jgi:holliday junction DNA helicase ruvA